MPQAHEGVFLEIDTVERDTPFRRVVQSREKLGDRRLSGAILSDEGDALARPQRESHVPNRPSLAVGIAETNILEHESRLNLRWHWPGIRRRLDRRPHLEEHKQVSEVQRLLGDVTRGEQNVLNDIAAAPERRSEECQSPDSDVAFDGADQNDDVRGVITDRAQYREQCTDDSAPDREVSVLLIESLREIAVSLRQPGRETEHLNFLRGLVT